MRKKLAEHKKMLISDVVYILLQPWFMCFTLGDGRRSLSTPVRIVMLLIVGTMLIINLFFFEQDCWQKMQKEAAKEDGNPWMLTFALLMQSVILIAPMVVGIHIKL